MKKSVLKFHDTISAKTKRFSSELKLQERQLIVYMTDLIIQQYWQVKFRLLATYIGLPIMIDTLYHKVYFFHISCLSPTFQFY